MSIGRITQLTTDAPKPAAHSSHATLIAELCAANKATEAERAKVKKLREAAAKRLEDGHNDTCNHLLSPKSRACDCGHDELRAALAETAE